MSALGEQLREARELRGVTLDEVEKATHIRAKHLAALEAGQLEALPSPVQARGFLRNYAEYLGLDADELVTRYDELHRQGQVTIPQTAASPRTGAPAPSGSRRMSLGSITVSSRARWFSMDLLVAGVVTAALIGIFVWGGARLASTVFDTGNPSPTVTAQWTTPGTPAATLPLISGTTATPTPPPPLDTFTNVQIKVVVQQRSWVRVLADGQEVFSGMAAPGQTLEYTGNQVVEILTGNGAGLHVTFNGRDQGPMGTFGQVVDRLWTLQGMITPTPSLTPTPTPTEQG